MARTLSARRATSFSCATSAGRSDEAVVIASAARLAEVSVVLTLATAPPARSSARVARSLSSEAASSAHLGHAGRGEEGVGGGEDAVRRGHELFEGRASSGSRAVVVHELGGLLRDRETFAAATLASAMTDWMSSTSRRWRRRR